MSSPSTTENTAPRDIPKVMTAVQVKEFHKAYEIRQVTTPRVLKPYDLLIKTVVASLCHTDIMVMEGKLPTRLPCTASHEGTGVVVAVGSLVTEFHKDDRVMSGLPRNACGQCEDCCGPDDVHQYCPHTEGSIGTVSDGAFAEYHVADSRSSCLIPDGLVFSEAAPLACAGRTIYRAIVASDVQPGQFLAIVGAGGGLGHLGIQFAQAKGIKVIALDARDEALGLCKKVGAAYIVDTRNRLEKIVAEVQAVTGGSGADATINVSAHTSSASLACAITRRHGTMVQTAAPDEVIISPMELIFRDIRVKGTLLAGRLSSQEMLAEYNKHNLKVETHLFYGLQQVPSMLDALKSGKLTGKAVCVVDEELYERDISMMLDKIRK